MISPAQYIQEFHKIGSAVKSQWTQNLNIGCLGSLCVFTRVCACVHLCMEMYAWPGIPMSREYLGCKSSASILFGT